MSIPSVHPCKRPVSNPRPALPVASRLLAFSLAAAALSLAGCGDASTDSNGGSYDATQVLSDVGTKVILATYLDLDAKADALAESVSAFSDERSQENLDDARQAWKDARRPWEQSEAFLFGPVSIRGIDPSIDSWPLNKTDLDGVLANGETLDKDYIDALPESQKGFHTIEYLLFGQGNDKKLEEFTDREFEYLSAVTLSFKGATSALAAAWDPDRGNFLDTLKRAGEIGAYTSQKAAVEELIDGMIGICDEVATGKIEDPFNSGDRTLEESAFSDNSNLDFQDNIRSVRNVYLGGYGSESGEGISTLVAARNPELDSRFKDEVDAAIAAIGEMSPTFGAAITGNKEKVKAAQDAILTVKVTLEAEIKPLLAD